VLFKRSDISFFWFIFLALASLVPFFIGPKAKEAVPSNIVERFHKNMPTLNSIDEGGEYVDSVFESTNNGDFDTVLYVNTASKFTKEKFYHGIAEYTIKENWLACLSSKLLWNHFSVMVDPDDIIKQQKGICSQQAIVFMELLKRREIKTRSVGLGYKEGPGHFLTEVYYNNDWHLYDVNKEPDWKKIVNHHNSMDYYLANKDTLYVSYQDQMEKAVFYKIMEKVQYGKPNDFSAKNMLIFHKLTKFTTFLFPFFFSIMALRFFFKRKKNSCRYN
jgi:hypothetical protein